MNDRMLSPVELAERLNVPVGHIYKMSADGRLPRHKIGKYVRFSWPEVLAALDEKEKETKK